MILLANIIQLNFIQDEPKVLDTFIIQIQIQEIVLRENGFDLNTCHKFCLKKQKI